MRGGWLAVAVLAWIASVVAASAAASGPTTCAGRPLLAADGQPSDLTDCDLDKQLEQAALREHLLGCVREASKARDRVYGKLRFDLDLHPGGGVAGVRFGRTAFRRTCLPDCLARTIRQRMGGPRQGRPAALQGHLTVAPGDEVDFGLSLSGVLAPPPKPKLRPLTGTFERDGSGIWSSCELGGARLVLQVNPQQPSAQSTWAPGTGPGEAIEACQALGEPGSPGRKRKGKRLSARARKRRVTSCLVDLLEKTGWELKAQAAEAIAAGWRWRGRRALQRAVEAGLRDAACASVDGKARAVVKTRSAAAKAGSGADESDACPLSPPADSVAGHALVRMLKAQLRLRRAPREGILAALASHPDPRVRLRLVDTVLAHWRTGVPEGLDLLVQDTDPLVRARAQQIGCLRGDWSALRAFKQDLRSSDPRNRAQSLLYARSCADRAARAVSDAAQSESSPVLALLMLRATPVQDAELVLRRAGPGLFDPCPLIRYLSVRLMRRLAEPPVDLARQALAREPEPLIKRQLVQITQPARSPDPGTVERLWLQAAGEPPRPARP